MTSILTEGSRSKPHLPSYFPNRSPMPGHPRQRRRTKPTPALPAYNTAYSGRCAHHAERTQRTICTWEATAYAATAPNAAIPSTPQQYPCQQTQQAPYLHPVGKLQNVDSFGTHTFFVSYLHASMTTVLLFSLARSARGRGEAWCGCYPAACFRRVGASAGLFFFFAYVQGMKCWTNC